MQYWHPHHHQRHRHPSETSWERYSRIAAPTDTVLTLDEAKAHLRVVHTDDDAYISDLIDAATAIIDGPSGIGIAMLNQTWVLTLEHLPLYFRIALGPVSVVTSITYLDNEGITQTVPSDQYTVITTTNPPQIINRFIPVDYVPETVQVTFTCGYGSRESDVPADLRQAVLLMVSHFYDVREVVSPTRYSTEIPFGVQAILDRYRVTSIS